VGLKEGYLQDQFGVFVMQTGVPPHLISYFVRFMVAMEDWVSKGRGLDG
jgi:hypothetical protein